VPEPGTLSLLGIGIATVIRRKFRPRVNRRHAARRGDPPPFLWTDKHSRFKSSNIDLNVD
jgi:hypothetical protein